MKLSEAAWWMKWYKIHGQMEGRVQYATSPKRTVYWDNCDCQYLSHKILRYIAIQLYTLKGNNFSLEHTFQTLGKSNVINEQTLKTTKRNEKPKDYRIVFCSTIKPMFG